MFSQVSYTDNLQEAYVKAYLNMEKVISVWLPVNNFLQLHKLDIINMLDKISKLEQLVPGHALLFQRHMWVRFHDVICPQLAHWLEDENNCELFCGDSDNFERYGTLDVLSSADKPPLPTAAAA